MARRKLKAVKFGNCEVAIYRDSYANEYVVQTKVGGKIQGGAESGGYFTDDKGDARSTAAATIRTMKARSVCKPTALGRARKRPVKRRK